MCQNAFFPCPQEIRMRRSKREEQKTDVWSDKKEDMTKLKLEQELELELCRTKTRTRTRKKNSLLFLNFVKKRVWI